MDIKFLTKLRYFHTVSWALLASCLVVAIAATLGRATLNLKGALSAKPDLAIYVLLKDRNIGKSTFLRETNNERTYLVDSEDGNLLVRLRKNLETDQWYLAEEETLHESASDHVLTTDPLATDLR